MNYFYEGKDFDINDMLGKTFVSVKKINDDEIKFSLEGGDEYVFYHAQDCCEHVAIKDIVGDLSDLEGSPILEASVAYSTNDPIGEDDEWGTHTWTFYKFGTIKGHVNISWYGSSNGYYSERVDQTFLPKKKVEEAEYK